MIEEIRLLSLSRSFEQRYKMTIRLLLHFIFFFLTAAAQIAVGGSFADENGREQIIEKTDSHPFWVVNKEAWVEAKDLQIGDTFLWANGELSTLVEKERVEYPAGITVYNFTVADNHNYFVFASLEAYQNGASVVLVHNGNYANYLGKSGEINSGITKNTDKYFFNQKGYKRIPDEWKDGESITEVKNVRYLCLSQQIKDDIFYAQKEGIVFRLIVDYNTKLSNSLEKLIDNGTILLLRMDLRKAVE